MCNDAAGGGAAGVLVRWPAERWATGRQAWMGGGRGQADGFVVAENAVRRCGRRNGYQTAEHRCEMINTLMHMYLAALSVSVNAIMRHTWSIFRAAGVAPNSALPHYDTP